MVEIKLSDNSEKPKADSCECRQRKSSQTVEKLEEHLKNISVISDKPPTLIESQEKYPKTQHPPAPPRMVDTTDYIGNFIGPIGKWQLRTIFLIYLTKIPASWFMSCIIFTAPTPQHGEIYCKPPVSNMSNIEEWVKIVHPIKETRADQELVIDFCNIYEDIHDHVKEYYNNTKGIDLFKEPIINSSRLIPCEAFEHKPEYVSIITQFDLYCSRDILVATTQFFHLFGVLCGGIVATNMMKCLDPKKVMLIGMLAQIVCGNLTGMMTIFELHMIFRCLSAVFCGLQYTAGGLIFTDITSGKYKIMAICLFEQFWSVGIMLLPAIASYWSSWTYLYMAISYPTIILIFLLPLVPNSPRWYIQRGKVKEAKEILLEAARINGKTDFNEADLEKQLHIQAAAVLELPPEPSYWEMWRGKGVAKNLIAVHLSWSIYIVIYYGFLLNIRNFGKFFLEENTIICGICEIIGTFIGLYFIMKTRKKWLYSSVMNIVASFISLSAHFIPPTVTPFERLVLLMVTSMASKIAISSTLALLMTCTTEIVSPEKRRLCGYTSTIWTRIWLLSAPFVGATSVFGQLVPQTALSCLNILGSLITAVIDTPRSIPEKAEKNNSREKSLEANYYPKELGVPDVWLSSYKENKIHL